MEMKNVCYLLSPQRIVNGHTQKDPVPVDKKETKRPALFIAPTKNRVRTDMQKIVDHNSTTND
jgi:hypothetical protein